MNENMGWTCPVCKRGVAPGVTYCEHGQKGNGPVPAPTEGTPEDGPVLPETLGFTSPPGRYNSGGREVVDRMRDECRIYAQHRFSSFATLILRGDVDQVGDLIFGAACRTHSLKYHLRQGLKKGDESGKGDGRKCQWWSEMELHITDGQPDPRWNRREGPRGYEEPDRLVLAPTHIDRRAGTEYAVIGDVMIRAIDGEGWSRGKVITDPRNVDSDGAYVQSLATMQRTLRQLSGGEPE
jgi:hypothetical protein